MRFPALKACVIVQIPGVKIDIKNRAGCSPLLLALGKAAEEEDFEPINLFTAKQKIKIEKEVSISLMESAINKNCAKLAALVLSNGFDACINHSMYAEDERHTPLWLACFKRSFAVADECIKFGAQLKNLPDDTTLFLAGHDNNQAEYITVLLASRYKFKPADFLRIIPRYDSQILSLMLSGEREEIISFYLCLLLTLMKHNHFQPLLLIYRPLYEAFRRKITSSAHLNALLKSKAYITITATLRELAIDGLIDHPSPEQDKLAKVEEPVEVKHDLIHGILATLSIIKADIDQIVPDFRLPKFLTKINEKILLKFSVEKLRELDERVNEWSQKTFYRLSKALENTDDTLAPPVNSTATPAAGAECNTI